MTGAESHFGIYYNVKAAFRNVFMKRAVYHTLVAYDNWFEVILFPFGVPIAPLYKGCCGGNVCLHRQQVGDICVFGVEQLLFYVGGDSVGVRYNDS